MDMGIFEDNFSPNDVTSPWLDSPSAFHSGKPHLLDANIM